MKRWVKGRHERTCNGRCESVWLVEIIFLSSMIHIIASIFHGKIWENWWWSWMSVQLFSGDALCAQFLGVNKLTHIRKRQFDFFWVAERGFRVYKGWLLVNEDCFLLHHHIDSDYYYLFLWFEIYLHQRRDYLWVIIPFFIIIWNYYFSGTWLSNIRHAGWTTRKVWECFNLIKWVNTFK